MHIMSPQGKVRIGHKAPFFHCEAVVKGAIEEVSLNTYIHPSIKPGTPNEDSPWLILLFIPAAFSFVCPTEVLAFQNCLDEFKDRNCNVVFVSVDTKHSLWHWQNVPRQYGGLGQIDIPLLSDANHRLSRDYGVLIEDEGISLRGMFIIDGDGLVQQVTLNNLTVGRSVLEALRLLEAFQAVAKHGVLCPIDWKPNRETSETLSTISNTLIESYDDRLANLQREFGVVVTDLDIKHQSNKDEGDAVVSGVGTIKSDGQSPRGGTPTPAVRPMRSFSSPQPPTIQRVPSSPPGRSNSLNGQRDDCLPHAPYRVKNIPKFYPTTRSSSAPQSANVTPTPTPTTLHPLATKHIATPKTTRHTRGTHTKHFDIHYMNSLFSQSAPFIFHSMIRHVSQNSDSTTDSSSGHSTTAPTPTPTPTTRTKSTVSIPPRLALQNTYESLTGSQVVLNFADPTSAAVSQGPLARSPSWSGPGPRPRSTSGNGWAMSAPETVIANGGDVSPSPTPSPSPGPTRLQATFEAIKKLGTGLASPRLENSPRKGDGGKSAMGGEEGRSPGYFDGL